MSDLPTGAYSAWHTGPMTSSEALTVLRNPPGYHLEVVERALREIQPEYEDKNLKAEDRATYEQASLYVKGARRKPAPAYDVQYDGPLGWTLLDAYQSLGHAVLVGLASASNKTGPAQWRVISPDDTVFCTLTRTRDGVLFNEGVK